MNPHVLFDPWRRRVELFLILPLLSGNIRRSNFMQWRDPYILFQNALCNCNVCIWSHGDRPAPLLKYTHDRQSNTVTLSRGMQSFLATVLLPLTEYVVLLQVEAEQKEAYCSTWRLSVLLPGALKLFTSSNTNSIHIHVRELRKKKLC